MSVLFFFFSVNLKEIKNHIYVRTQGGVRGEMCRRRCAGAEEVCGGGGGVQRGAGEGMSERKRIK